MANITELQLQGDSTVHKLNDARITTTAVTTATHILTTNSGVTSIAPITAADLASVLGGSTSIMFEATDAKFDALYGTSSVHTFNGYSGTYFDDNTYGFVKTTMGLEGYCIQEVYNILTKSYWRRTKTSSAASWSSFTRADNFGCNTLPELASALGGSLKENLVISFDSEKCKTWGTGLYFLFGENSYNFRYALVYVAHPSDGYAVIPIGDTADFGSDSKKYNLLYQINSDGVKFRTGSAQPCYIKKLM